MERNKKSGSEVRLHEFGNYVYIYRYTGFGIGIFAHWYISVFYYLRYYYLNKNASDCLHIQYVQIIGYLYEDIQYL